MTNDQYDSVGCFNDRSCAVRVTCANTLGSPDPPTPVLLATIARPVRERLSSQGFGGFLVSTRFNSFQLVSTRALIHSKRFCFFSSLALSHSRTLALSHSRTLALSHSRTLALSHSRTLALSYSRTLVLSYSRTYACSSPLLCSNGNLSFIVGSIGSIVGTEQAPKPT
jgi:hypothetical protein